MKDSFWIKMLFIACLVIVFMAAEGILGLTENDTIKLMLILIYFELLKGNK